MSGPMLTSYFEMLKQAQPSFPADKFRQVEVVPMTEDIARLAAPIVEMKQCYYNVATMAIRHEAELSEASDVKYVVGYALSIIPIEHAWLKVDGVHYDPTLELVSSLGLEYMALAELSVMEMIETMAEMDSEGLRPAYCADSPPTPYDIINLMGKRGELTCRS